MGMFVLAILGVWVAVDIDVGVLGGGVVNEQVCVTVGSTTVGGECWGVVKMITSNF